MFIIPNKRYLLLPNYGYRWVLKKMCILSIVDEKSVTNTNKFLIDLEARMGFKIQTVQIDNGREFTNYGVKERECVFDKVLRKLGIKHKLIRPFSLWQNGKAKRSHKVDE